MFHSVDICTKVEGNRGATHGTFVKTQKKWPKVAPASECSLPPGTRGKKERKRGRKGGGREEGGRKEGEKKRKEKQSQWLDQRLDEAV